MGATILDLTAAERQQWIDSTSKSYRILIDEIGGRTAELYGRIQAGKSAFAESMAGSEDDDVNASR